MSSTEPEPGKEKIRTRSPVDFDPWPPEEKMNFGQRVVYRLWDRPATWFREKYVLPGRAGNVYYHRKFQRVPTVDECYADDVLCAWEATQQWKRDRKVDSTIVEILKKRWENCMTYYVKELKYDQCEQLLKDYLDAEKANFIKNGELGVTATARDAYFKQVHRLILQRREALAKEAREKSGNQD